MLIQSSLSFPLPEVTGPAHCEYSLTLRGTYFPEEVVYTMEKYIKWLGDVLGLAQLRKQQKVEVIILQHPANPANKARGMVKKGGSEYWVEIYLANIAEVDTLHVTLAHEMIHLYQLMSGALEYQDRRMVWVSERMPPKLVAGSGWGPSYTAYRNQPHEREAWYNDRLLYQGWKNRCHLLNQTPKA